MFEYVYYMFELFCIILYNFKIHVASMIAVGWDAVFVAIRSERVLGALLGAQEGRWWPWDFSIRKFGMNIEWAWNEHGVYRYTPTCPQVWWLIQKFSQFWLIIHFHFIFSIDILIHIAILGYSHPDFWGPQDTGWDSVARAAPSWRFLRRVDVHNSFELVCVESGGQRTKPQRISSQSDGLQVLSRYVSVTQIPSNPMVCHEFPNSMATEIYNYCIPTIYNPGISWVLAISQTQFHWPQSILGHLTSSSSSSDCHSIWRRDASQSFWLQGIELIEELRTPPWWICPGDPWGLGTKVFPRYEFLGPCLREENRNFSADNRRWENRNFSRAASPIWDHFAQHFGKPMAYLEVGILQDLNRKKLTRPSTKRSRRHGCDGAFLYQLGPAKPKHNSSTFGWNCSWISRMCHDVSKMSHPMLGGTWTRPGCAGCKSSKMIKNWVL